MHEATIMTVLAFFAILLVGSVLGVPTFPLAMLIAVVRFLCVRRSGGVARDREPLVTDVAMIISGPIVVAISYSIRFNDIPYRPGDYRATPAYNDGIFAVGLIVGVILVVVGSFRLAQGLLDRRRR